MRKRVADIIVEALVERGVTQCFGVVGGGAMYLDNALGRNAAMKKIFNHHEQASAMAADAYARLTGRPAMVSVTTGPGGTNALTGVMGAWVDSVPMVVISGQVRTAISVEATGLPLRYRGVQEFEIIPAARSMTKYAVRLKDPLDARREVNKAFDIAMAGRRGPVWLDVPLDIQSAVVETGELYPDEPAPEEPRAGDADILFVLDKLKSAKRPAILAGSGIVNSGCLTEFRALARKLRVPVVGAHVASDVMPMDDELYFGTAGLLGPRAGNFIVQNSDVLLSIGCSLGLQMTGFAPESFAPKAYLISVDADPYESKKPGLHVDRFLHSTARKFIEKFGDICESELPVPTEWLDYCSRAKMRFSPYEAGRDAPDNERVCMYRFWEEFDRLAPAEYVSVIGPHFASTARHQAGAIHEDQRIITNKNCGSMGMCLPFAIGAAAEGTPVICATGDGSIMMNLQELQTIRHYGLPVKVVVFENDGYGGPRQTNKNYFDGYNVGCDRASGVSFPPFSKVADAFGFSYRLCATNGDLEDSLRWFFETEGQAFLEVSQRLDDPVLPKVMSRPTESGEPTAPALEDMYPFLPEEEQAEWMLVKE